MRRHLDRSARFARAGLFVLWALAALSLCVLPSVSRAQPWFSAEACRVDAAEVDPRVLPPKEEAALRVAARDIVNGTGRFWRITSPDGAVSHLWGSLHSSDRLILDLPAEVRGAIAGARVVALEYNPVAADRAALEQQQYPPQMWRSEWLPPDMRTDFPADIRSWIEMRLEYMGWGADILGELSDAGLAQIVLSDPCEDFASGVIPFQDNYIGTLAHIAGIPIVGLEPADAFVSDLASPENQERARAMVQVFAAYLAPWDGPSGRATWFALYRQGRIAEMMVWDNAYLASILGEDQAERLARLTYGYLLDTRNHRFVETARPLLDEGGLFIVAGSFHLPGDAGLVALLRQAGYDVVRISLPGEAP